jgi:hypothetical protein
MKENQVTLLSIAEEWRRDVWEMDCPSSLCFTVLSSCVLVVVVVLENRFAVYKRVHLQQGTLSAKANPLFTMQRNS